MRQLRVMIQHLPPDNPAQRELHGRWSEEMWLLYDAGSTLRVLLAQIQTLFRDKNTPPVEAELLPTPEQQAKNAATQRSPVRKQMERDHLQSVLGRANPH